jgi:hypothetical protein
VYQSPAGANRFASLGNNWAFSIFASQDPVAIDSVGLDFLRNEPNLDGVVTGHVDNCLHEAALAGNPPSKTVYDPDGDAALKPGRPRALEQPGREEILPQSGQGRRNRAGRTENLRHLRRR